MTAPREILRYAEKRGCRIKVLGQELLVKPPNATVEALLEAHHDAFLAWAVDHGRKGDPRPCRECDCLITQFDTCRWCEERLLHTPDAPLDPPPRQGTDSVLLEEAVEHARVHGWDGNCPICQPVVLPPVEYQMEHWIEVPEDVAAHLEPFWERPIDGNVKTVKTVSEMEVVLSEAFVTEPRPDTYLCPTCGVRIPTKYAQCIRCEKEGR